MSNSDFSLQDLYHLIGEYESGRSRPRISRPTRASLIALLISAFFMLVAAVCLIFKTHSLARLIGMSSLLIALLVSYASMLIPIIADLLRIKENLRAFMHPVRTTLERSLSISQSDYEFSVKLTSYDEAFLRFSARQMRIYAEGMRFNVGVLIGSLERIGFLPLIITFVLGVWGLWPKVKAGDFLVDSPTFELVVVGLMVMYPVGAFRLSTSRRIDKLADVVEFSNERRALLKSLGSGADTKDSTDFSFDETAAL